jgi:hypothetical protein
MIMNNPTPKLILPAGLQAQKAAEQREAELQELKNKKVKLPPALEQDVKKHIPKAQEIHEQVLELLKSQGGLVALLMQDSFRKILSDYMQSIVPQVILEACKLDRVSLLNVIQQVMSNELTNAQVNKTPLDPASYRKAVSDIACVFKQTPAPPLNLQIALPDFELDPPEDKDLKLVPEE